MAVTLRSHLFHSPCAFAQVCVSQTPLRRMSLYALWWMRSWEGESLVSPGPTQASDHLVILSGFSIHHNRTRLILFIAA